MRTGARRHDSSAPQKTKRVRVELHIGPHRLRQVLFGRHETRRIDENDVGLEVPAGVGKLRKQFFRVVDPEFTFPFEPVEFRAFDRGVDRALRTVDSEHAQRAVLRGVQRERPGVTVEVQDGFPLHERPNRASVFPLVEVESRFLRALRIDLEFKAVLFDHQILRQRSEHRTALSGKAFERAGGMIVLLIDRRRIQQPSERGDQRLDQIFHSRG